MSKLREFKGMLNTAEVIADNLASHLKNMEAWLAKTYALKTMGEITVMREKAEQILTELEEMTTIENPQEEQEESSNPPMGTTSIAELDSLSDDHFPTGE